MKKNGFTLAEVLIALGLVGILSAMTVPTLVKNNQNQILSNSLSTAVSDFENAMTAMITRENVSNLHETRAWEDINFNEFVDILSEIINVTDRQENSNNFYCA
jgi:prepilin-type N-terminal cleavage/methylation domain-containing protein